MRFCVLICCLLVFSFSAATKANAQQVCLYERNERDSNDPIKLKMDRESKQASVTHSYIHVWDAATQKTLLEFKGGGGRVDFNGSLLARAEFNREELVVVVEVETGRQVDAIPSRSPNEYCEGVAISPDGKLIAFNYHHKRDDIYELRVYERSSKEVVFSTPKFGNGYPRFEFLDDRTLVAGGSPKEGGKLLIWDVLDNKLLHEDFWHQGGVVALAVSADGHTIASQSNDQLRVSRFENGELELVRKIDTRVGYLSLSGDGRFLTAGSSSSIWDLQADEEISELGSSMGIITVDGTSFISIGTNEHHLSAWSVSPLSKRFKPASVHELGSEVERLRWGKDNNKVALSLDDDLIHFNVSENRIEVRRSKLRAQRGDAAIDPDLDFVFADDQRDGAPVRFNLRSGRLTELDVRSLARAMGKSVRYPDLAYDSADGLLRFVDDGGRRVHVYDEATKKVVYQNQYWRPQYAVSLSPHQKYLAAGGEVIELESGTKLAELRVASVGRYHDLQFDPNNDHHLFYTDGGTELSLLDLKSGKRTQPFPLLNRSGWKIRWIYLAKKKHILIVFSGNKEIQLWNYQTGEYLGALNGLGEEDRVTAINISPNETKLAGGTKNGQLVVWDISPWTDESETRRTDLAAAKSRSDDKSDESKEPILKHEIILRGEGFGAFKDFAVTDKGEVIGYSYGRIEGQRSVAMRLLPAEKVSWLLERHPSSRVASEKNLYLARVSNGGNAALFKLHSDLLLFCGKRSLVLEDRDDDSEFSHTGKHVFLMSKRRGDPKLFEPINVYKFEAFDVDDCRRIISKELPFTVDDHFYQHELAYDVSNQRVFLVGRKENDSGSLRRVIAVDLKANEIIWDLEGVDSKRRLFFDEDSNSLVMASDDEALIVDADSGEYRSSFKYGIEVDIGDHSRGPCLRAMLSPDGRWFAAVDDETSSAVVFDLHANNKRYELKTEHQEWWKESRGGLRFSPNSKYLGVLAKFEYRGTSAAFVVWELGNRD